MPPGNFPGEAGRNPGMVLGVDKSRGILIQTGNGILIVTRLQLASRKPLDYRAFLNGVKMESGTILGRVHES
jgi:methionyl-tRNA formyltransferase